MAVKIIPREASALAANRDSEIFTVVGVFLVLAAIALGSRFASKRILRKPLRIDDYLVVVAFVILVAEAASFIWTAKYGGLGHHKASLSLERIIAYEKVFFVGSILQPCTLAFAKISVLVFLRRIFVTRAFKWTANILMLIVVCWCLSDALGGALICQPVRSSWDPRVPNNCGNRYIFNVVGPLPWILTDFVILICPLPMVWRLHASTRHKVALGGIFLVGALTCIVSCIRYSYTFFSLEDPTWDAVPLWKWNIIEASVTVICACLFASKPVMMLIIPDKLIARLRSRSHSWTRYRRKAFLHARGGRSEGSLESSHLGGVSLHTAQSHPHQAVRYDLESYGDVASHTFLDNSEAVTEPLPATIRKGSAL